MAQDNFMWSRPEGFVTPQGFTERIIDGRLAGWDNEGNPEAATPDEYWYYGPDGTRYSARGAGSGWEGETIPGTITNPDGSSLVPYDAQVQWANSQKGGWNEFISKYGPMLAIGGGVALAGMAGAGVAGAAGAGASSGGGVGALSGMDLAADAGSLFSGNGGFAGGGFSAGGAAAGATPSLWEQLMKFVSGGGSGGGAGAGGLKGLLGGPASTIFSIGSGLYGMKKSSDMQKTAAQAAAMQDPFGPHRAGYAADLRSLMSDPSKITSMPGYKAGLDAVERKMASQGYLGSGNMMLALLKYGGDFFNQEVSRLAQLAGAQFGPSGGQALISGNISANDLASRALASLGYGIRQFETGR